MNFKRHRGFLTVLWVALLAGVLARAASTDELKPFDARSLNAIRAANQGKPFVLAFWSLHCAPCKEDMVLLKAIKARHPGLAIVLVATDGPKEHEAVVRFLASQNLGRIEQWEFADEFEERLRYSVDPGWRGELPRTYLFDSGHRVTAQSGVLDPKLVGAWLGRVFRRP